MTTPTRSRQHPLGYRKYTLPLPLGFAIRLHVWTEPGSEDPHNHRWDFVGVPLWGRFHEIRWRQVPGSARRIVDTYPPDPTVDILHRRERRGFPPRYAWSAQRPGGFLLHRGPPGRGLVLRPLHRRFASPRAPGRRWALVWLSPESGWTLPRPAGASPRGSLHHRAQARRTANQFGSRRATDTGRRSALQLVDWRTRWPLLPYRCRREVIHTYRPAGPGWHVSLVLRGRVQTDRSQMWQPVGRYDLPPELPFRAGTPRGVWVAAPPSW